MLRALGVVWWSRMHGNDERKVPDMFAVGPLRAGPLFWPDDRAHCRVFCGPKNCPQTGLHAGLGDQPPTVSLFTLSEAPRLC
jgi:hypothetical protein